MIRGVQSTTVFASRLEAITAASAALTVGTLAQLQLCEREDGWSVTTIVQVVETAPSQPAPEPLSA